MDDHSWASLFTLAVIAIFGFRVWRGTKLLRDQGREVRPRLPAAALFAEDNVSGFSDRGGLSRLSGGSRVLLVWVTEREFVVDLIFPFNVFFADGLGLRHRVPRAAIASATLVDGRTARITFQDVHGRSHTLVLVLRNPQALVRALSARGATWS